ncbi:MAG TPA: hypothetical protein DEO83_02480 [Lachnospiraceae bacterium]|jgi:hypothetical protein|nr:hypothetical protein [Eubacterium sp.]HBZ02665.1 hypothetical protein [Lachnospiraceae bacterium]
MANKIGRIVLGIIIIVGILVGGYFLLPGQVKNPLTAKLQDMTDANYAVITGAVKNATIPKNKGVTFDSAMTNKTEHPAWTIKKISVDDAGNGSYDVYADGYKCTVSMENETNDTGMVTFTNAHVQLVFHITKQGSEIKIGDKVVEEGKAAAPSEVNVNETTYKSTDKSSYYQAALNVLAGN